MKSTGIVRPLDQLGRVVLPIELRRTLEIGGKESLEISSERNMILIKKHSPSCYLCGKSDCIMGFRGKLICCECVEDIKKGMY